MGSVVVPTWDLFIIIFGCLIVGYNIIIGRELTIRLIIASYIAMLAADGLVTIGHRILTSENQLLAQLPKMTVDSQEIIFGKIIIFLAFIALLSARGGFKATEKESSQILNFIHLLLFAILSAGLIITALLAFISGGSFIDAFTFTGAQANNFATMLFEQSKITRILVNYASIIYAAPALALIISNIGSAEEE